MGYKAASAYRSQSVLTGNVLSALSVTVDAAIRQVEILQMHSQVQRDTLHLFKLMAILQEACRPSGQGPGADLASIVSCLFRILQTPGDSELELSRQVLLLIHEALQAHGKSVTNPLR